MGEPEDTIATKTTRAASPATPKEMGLFGLTMRSLGCVGLAVVGLIVGTFALLLFVVLLVPGESYGDVETEPVTDEAYTSDLFEEEEFEDRGFRDDFKVEAQLADDSNDPEEFAEAYDEPDFDDRPWATLDSAALDFDDMPEPTFEANLADLGNDRLREIEFFLPEGDGPIDFAIRNPDPIAIDGQGIAVRTDDFAQILYSSQLVTVERPAECFDGNCRLFMWLSMGPTFLEFQPEAELLIWAGEGAQVTIENMPMENFRDETFR